MSDTPGAIYLDNDFEFDFVITRRNTTTRVVEAATGLTGLTGHLSATVDGAAIDADVSKSLTEAGSTGYYTAVVDGDDLRTHLASYVGQSVWAICSDAGNIKVTRRYVVYDVRPMEPA